MELIDPKSIKKITEARKVIAELQTRLLDREQVLDDLARAAEIAEITNKFHLVASFRQTAEERLQDRLITPIHGENTEMKIRIFE